MFLIAFSYEIKLCFFTIPTKNNSLKNLYPNIYALLDVNLSKFCCS